MTSPRAPNPTGGGSQGRKLAFMAVLLALGLLLWGRLLFWKNVPRTALANPQAEAQALAIPKPMAQTSVRGNAGRTLVKLEIPARMERDLFVLDAAAFGAKEADPTVSPVTTVNQSKSPPGLADLNQRLLAAKASLTLQSTIQGERPQAVINGQLLTPGDRIGGCVLRKVLQRRVILELEGTEIQLDM